MRSWQQIPCPIERTATLLADHYTIMIVRDLSGGPRRFSELAAAGINPRTLSARLRHLQNHGFVLRDGLLDRPGIRRYRLSRKGEALMPLIVFLRQYGETWLPVGP